MNLLFKREQGTSNWGRVNFKLWSKVELDEDELEIVKRYKFDQAELISAFQPGLLRRALVFGAVIAAVMSIILVKLGVVGIFIGIAAGGATGYLWFHQNRETIFVKDLIHGRHFACGSVVALAKQEQFVTDAVGVLRQIMESAKHWDGTETIAVPVLPKDEARQFIVQYA